MITAPTRAKIAMQIAVVNQKTRSIPSRSSAAFGGNHGTSSATSVEAAPMTTPIMTS